MRIVVSGGGTGGHIYPALALARYATQKDAKNEILFIGTARGLESDIVPRTGFRFLTIEASGLRRSWSLDNVKTVVRTYRGYRQSKRILRDFRPDVVVGTGGYVCGPLVYAARKMRIPSLILEPDALPGLTNRLLCRYADTVAVCFPDARRWFKRARNLVISGNPRGTEVRSVTTPEVDAIRKELGLKDNCKTVVVVGGSRGARPINDAVLGMLPQVDKQTQFQLVYVTGQVHYDTVNERVEKLHLDSGRVIVRPYVYNMPALLKATDLAVSRAGATFLAESTALGVPSILIPSPYVTHNHQHHNARWISERGAAILMEEKELTSQKLFAQIEQLAKDSGRLSEMRAKSLELGLPDAAQTLYMTLQSMAKRSLR